MSTTAEIQAYVRANTATAYSYEGDLHALCDLAGVPAGHLLERLGALLETLPQGVLALLQNGSVEELLPILAPFSPASLFANGEQGLWYDISDFDRYMSELGPNSVVNGGFDDGLTGWTAKADVIVDGGRAKCFATNVVFNAVLRQTQPFNGAGWYRIRGNVQNVSMQTFCQLQARYVSNDAYIAASHPNAHPIGAVSAADFSFYADAPFYINLLIDLNVNYPSRIAYVDNIRCEKLTAINTATLFQDAAGTIPVTAVEQPVGRILDKSGRGNHASQATTTARGVLRARYNLLTYSEDFSNAAWERTSSRVTSTVNTIDCLDAGNTEHMLRRNGIPFAVGAEVVSRFEAKMREVRYAYIRPSALSSDVAVFDLQTGDVSYQGTGLTASIQAAGDGWYACTVRYTPDNAATGFVDFGTTAVANNRISTIPFGHGIFVRKADHRFAIPASLPPYQRIAAATDYDTVGFPVYLDVDGTDDSYQTGNINFTATDKVTIWAGMRKLDDTARILCELSANVAAAAGSFYVVTGIDGLGNPRYSTLSRGSTGPSANTTARFAENLYPAPDSAVITATHDIAGDLSRIRRNGSSAGAIDGTADKGTGNFGNYPLYLFSRGGTSVRWKGHFYGLIIRGAATDTTQLEQAEQWINSKMGGIY